MGKGENYSKVKSKKRRRESFYNVSEQDIKNLSTKGIESERSGLPSQQPDNSNREPI